MEVITRDVLGTHFLIPVGEDCNLLPMELNETAYEIYTRLSRGETIEFICVALAKQYGMSVADLQDDVTSCYNNLHSKGMI